MYYIKVSGFSQVKDWGNVKGLSPTKIGPILKLIVTLSNVLSDYSKKIPIVLDPVMSSQTGASLIKNDFIDLLLKKIIPQSFLVTPNLPEAEILLGRKIRTIDDMLDSINSLRSLGSEAVLLKGGHLEGDFLVDILITKESFFEYRSEKIKTNSTHGTGCALSSAIATGLAQSFGLKESVVRARDFVYKAITSSPGYGKGSGPLNHCHSI